MEKVVHDTPYDDIFIEFHGGEPLLQKKVIFAAVDRGNELAGKKYKKIHFSLQTNGALLDDDLLLWAREKKIRIGISLDGPPALHDRHRKKPGGSGTFHQVWARIQSAWRLGLEPGFMGVVHESSDYLRAYEFFVSSGILCFKLNYAAALGRAASELEFLRTRGQELAHGALEMLDAAVLFNKKSPLKLKIYDFNLYMAALAGKKREYMCLRSPCGAGRSLLAIGTGGEIYPCEEMSTYPEFACGSIFSEKSLTALVDESGAIHRMRERQVGQFEPCASCPWRYFCAGKCLHKAFHRYGTIMREDPMCQFYSTLFEELIWRIDSDRDYLSLI